MRLASVTVLAFAGLCFPAYASTFQFSGNFTADDNQLEFLFNTLSPGTVTLQTWSYGGGIDPLGAIVPPGGFAPVLSLFDSSGTLLGFDTGGPPCPPRNIDPSTGLCLDAFLNPTLPAGTYRLVLTEYDNIPVGSTYADGFLRTGQGNFTGPEFLGTPGSFIDPGLNQRNSSYHLTIGPVESAFQITTVPEPSTAFLLSGAAILSVVVARLRRRKQARHRFP